MKHDPFVKSSNCTECDVEGRPMIVYNILIAYDYDPDFPPPNFLWKTLLEDAMIGKTIEEEFTGEPGGIFCTVCDTHCEGGTCIEDGDLTTHLMSETHEIEIFGKSSETIFDSELSLAYKCGSYCNIPPEKMTQLLRNHPETSFLFFFPRN
ncbi:hypothetical protein Bca4012_031372 [Brassica carinata]